MLDKSSLLVQLHLQRDLHQRYYQRIRDEMAEEIRQKASELPHLAKDALLWDATRRLGELQQAAYLQWLDETIQRIEKEF